METLVTVTIPVFGIILTGYLAGKFSLLSEHSAKAINAFVYYFSLPALLFLLTTKADFAEIANFSFILVFSLNNESLSSNPTNFFSSDPYLDELNTQGRRYQNHQHQGKRQQHRPAPDRDYKYFSHYSPPSH